MGEFGALSVVTQNLPGQQNTLPREIENLYSNFGGSGIPGAFALSTLLAMLGVVTLFAKSVLEWKIQRDAAGSTESGGGE
jgi:sulfate transport system permease protein